jgi:alanine racemase
MDQFVVDCGSSTPAVGEETVLFGDAARGHPLASEWAAQTRRSALELTANLGSRVVRVAS